ncbi:MAG TPA: hypothetical protein VK634_19745 [Reyranella sp.]|nr:hypothetical protein [Reyranella sp.]HTE82929.1 hypothetical protein [Reyranella sp.]
MADVVTLEMLGTLMHRMLDDQRAMGIKLDRVIREIQALKQHSVATNEHLLAVRKDVANLDERMARTETRLALREEA